MIMITQVEQEVYTVLIICMQFSVLNETDEWLHSKWRMTYVVNNKSFQHPLPGPQPKKCFQQIVHPERLAKNFKIISEMFWSSKRGFAPLPLCCTWITGPNAGFVSAQLFKIHTKYQSQVTYYSTEEYFTNSSTLIHWRKPPTGFVEQENMIVF